MFLAAIDGADHRPGLSTTLWLYRHMHFADDPHGATVYRKDECCLHNDWPRLVKPP